MQIKPMCIFSVCVCVCVRARACVCAHAYVCVFVCNDRKYRSFIAAGLLVQYGKVWIILTEFCGFSVALRCEATTYGYLWFQYCWYVAACWCVDWSSRGKQL